ncbi:MAG TPA: diguanylate cyclase [Dehalococcoidia bacterium]|jgi:diguanylate cyclase (GGDEF)-like protein|nr:diguanylate cyclase [Dehalococcoidia bacterium]
MAKKTVRVLLVEDNDHDAEIVQRMLSKYAAVDFHLDRVRSTKECLIAVAASTFDLLLLDYSLPGEDGVSFLRRLNGSAELPPVIILSGWGDSRVAADAMHSGAYDYFPKNSINSQVLAHAIHQALEKHRSGNEEKRLREELERLAITDELTAVYNRRYMTQALDRECNRARRYRRHLACLMVDLDDFKKYNDSHGHLVGDVALKQVAAMISQCVRETDIVVRFGGEEFVVIMPEAQPAAAMLAAERIRDSISGQALAVTDGDVAITVSIGVCTSDDEHEIEPDTMLACADKALRRAKTDGKNRVYGSPPRPASVA